MNIYLGGNKGCENSGGNKGCENSGGNKEYVIKFKRKQGANIFFGANKEYEKKVKGCRNFHGNIRGVKISVEYFTLLRLGEGVTFHVYDVISWRLGYRPSRHLKSNFCLSSSSYMSGDFI